MLLAVVIYSEVNAYFSAKIAVIVEIRVKLSLHITNVTIHI